MKKLTNHVNFTGSRWCSQAQFLLVEKDFESRSRSGLSLSPPFLFQMHNRLTVTVFTVVTALLKTAQSSLNLVSVWICRIIKYFHRSSFKMDF
jgi:hypothetical protein